MMNTSELLLLLCLIATIPIVSSYSITTRNKNVNACQTRGTFLKKSIVVSLATSCIAPQISNAAAIEKAEGKILRSSGTCAYGEGDGCDELSGGNDYIKELQRKSAENKAATQKEYLSAYQMKNYPDFFASLTPPKYLVKMPDDSFKLYEDDELTALKKAGKIKLEKPTAMKGQVVDVTQKPILVLVE